MMALRTPKNAMSLERYFKDWQVPEYSTFDDAVPHLTSRFFLNLPLSEFSEFHRLFFQFEQAFWFYLDHLRKASPSLPRLKLETFCRLLFQYVNPLRKFQSEFSALYAEFRAYLSSIPVCGAILLNGDMTHCVMIKGYNGKRWSFPRGKRDQNESDVQSAVREVKEETGYDCSADIDRDNFVSVRVRGRRFVMFLVEGVPDDADLSPQTAYEIAAIDWVPLEEVMGTLKKKKKKQSSKTRKFVLVREFARGLRQFLVAKRPDQWGYLTGQGKKKKKGKARNSSESDGFVYDVRRDGEGTELRGKNKGSRPDNDDYDYDDDYDDGRDADWDPNALLGLESDEDEYGDDYAGGGWSAADMFKANAGLVDKDAQRAARDVEVSLHGRLLKTSADAGHRNDDYEDDTDEDEDGNGGGWSAEQMFQANAHLVDAAAAEEARETAESLRHKSSQKKKNSKKNKKKNRKRGGKGQQDAGSHKQSVWSAEDMFRDNKEAFGVKCEPLRAEDYGVSRSAVGVPLPSPTGSTGRNHDELKELLKPAPQQPVPLPQHQPQPQPQQLPVHQQPHHQPLQQHHQQHPQHPFHPPQPHYPPQHFQSPPQRMPHPQQQHFQSPPQRMPHPQQQHFQSPPQHMHPPPHFQHMHAQHMHPPHMHPPMHAMHAPPPHGSPYQAPPTNTVPQPPSSADTPPVPARRHRRPVRHTWDALPSATAVRKKGPSHSLDFDYS